MTLSYRAVHKRLDRNRGKASTYICECGEPAGEWALIGEPTLLSERGSGYSEDLDAYRPLCARCHHVLDRGYAPCPHGPERVVDLIGRCIACQRERRREKYGRDPVEHRASREAINRRNRERQMSDPAYRERKASEMRRWRAKRREGS